MSDHQRLFLLIAIILFIIAAVLRVGGWVPERFVGGMVAAGLAAFALAFY